MGCLGSFGCRFENPKGLHVLIFIFLLKAFDFFLLLVQLVLGGETSGKGKKPAEG